MSIPVLSTMAEQSVDTTTSPGQLQGRQQSQQEPSTEASSDSLSALDSPFSTSPLSRTGFDLNSPLSAVYNPLHQHNRPNRNSPFAPSNVAVHGSVPSSPVLKGFKTTFETSVLRGAVPEEGRNQRDDVPQLNLAPQAAKEHTEAIQGPVKAVDPDVGFGPAPQFFNSDPNTAADQRCNKATTVCDEPCDVKPQADPASVKIADMKLSRPVLNSGNLAAVSAAVQPMKAPVLNHRVIALDFDGVVSHSFQASCDEHNDLHGSDLTLDDIQSYSYFQNRGSGTPAEVARKMQKIGSILPKTAPIPGFAEGLRALHAMGHLLHIITARPERHRDAVYDWLAQQGVTVGLHDEDTVAAIWFTDIYKGTQPELEEKGEGPEDEKREAELNERLKAVYRDDVGKGRGGQAKLNVLRAIGASLFVDDHHGNLEPCVDAVPRIQCILFGSWPWNQARSGISSPLELMSYEERQKAGVSLPLAPIEHGEEKGLHRVKDWEAVVNWVREWDKSEIVETNQADDISTAAVVEDMSYTDDQSEAVGDSPSLPQPTAGPPYGADLPY